MTEVAVSMGKTPSWVMRSFTYPQLGLMYAKIQKVEFDRVEMQARLVWAVANGWKRAEPLKGDKALDKLKSLGMVVET